MSPGRGTPPPGCAISWPGAELAAIRDPERLTVEFLKRERRGRVFVDWLRNTPGATVVVPFSLRPTPVASVAVPITWDELAAADPDGWRIDDLDDRLAITTDLASQRLPVHEIVAAAREAGAELDVTFDRFGRRTKSAAMGARVDLDDKEALRRAPDET